MFLSVVPEFSSRALPGSRRRSLQHTGTSKSRSASSRANHITFSNLEPATTTAQIFPPIQQTLSPIASLSSSTSCIPKSSSSTGPMSTHSPVDYSDLQQQSLVDKSNTSTINEIDERLEAINM